MGRKVVGRRKARAEPAEREPKKPPPADLEGKRGRIPPEPNPAFTAFYRANLVDTGVVPEEEWEQFLEAFRRPLPCTVWITPTDVDAQSAKEFFRESQAAAAAAGADPGGDVPVVRPLRWIPDDNGWFIDLPRTVLRKDPRFKPLHQFLIERTERGCLNRQEEVSMLPVHLLGIEAGDLCLDMCASPGSKTAQMLSALASANLKARGRGGCDPAHCDGVRRIFQGRIQYTEDEGAVVANDISSDRINMLVHQIKRLSDLFPLVVLTNHDARYFPSLPRDRPRRRFDKVLCDVMCSGDGTLRKLPHLWRQWNAKTSIDLFPMQLSVVQRAARLLRVGGRIAYSTCTLSPVEDEAVVAELLRSSHGALRVVDCSSSLSGLRTSKGLHSWRVMCPKTGALYSTHEEAVAAGAELRPEIFPPADAAELGLSKCMRLLPHHNDTGGFFVCILEKVDEVPQDGFGYDSDRDEDGEAVERMRRRQRLEEALRTGKSDIEKKKAEAQLRRARESGGLSGEVARYRNLESMRAVRSQLREVYGVPDCIAEQMICRYHVELTEDGEEEPLYASGGANQLLYCSRCVSELFRDATGPSVPRKWKIVSGGLRAFQKDRFTPMEKSTSYRIGQEALDLLLPYLQRRIVRVRGFENTAKLLSNRSKSLPIKGFSDEDRAVIEDLSVGGCAVLLRTGEGDFVAASALRTLHALNIYVDDHMLPQLRARCGVEYAEEEESASPKEAAEEQ